MKLPFRLLLTAAAVTSVAGCSMLGEPEYWAPGDELVATKALPQAAEDAVSAVREERHEQKAEEPAVEERTEPEAAPEETQEPAPEAVPEAAPEPSSAEAQQPAEPPRTKSSLIALIPGETSAKVMLKTLGKPTSEAAPSAGRVLVQYRTHRVAIINGYQKDVPMLVVLAPDDPRIEQMPEKILTLDFQQRPNGWVMTGYKLD